MTWKTVYDAWATDEFVLDPTRITLLCGTAGFDGTAFKGLLASKFDIQLNKTSRNSVLLQTNINNTRSDIAYLIKVLADISRDLDRKLAEGSRGEGRFDARVKSLCHRRARPAELQPLPRRLPRQPEVENQRGRHAHAVLPRLRRGQLHPREAEQQGDRRLA